MAKTLKILVADDNKDRLDLFRDVLSKGNEFITVQDPVGALKLLGTKKFDFVFLDYEFKNATMDGEDLAWMLPDTVNRGTKIFVHSLNSKMGELMVKEINDKQGRAEYLEFGGKGFIDKLRSLNE